METPPSSIPIPEKEYLPTTVETLSDGRPHYVSEDIFVFRRPTMDDLAENNELFSEISEAIQINLNLPHTGFGYALNEGFSMDAIRKFNVLRLNEIPQLARLSDPDIVPDKVAVSAPFTHSRYAHTLDVLACASVILNNNREHLTENEVRTGQLATISHDALTPAGGDTTKMIDREAFDEDLNYPSLFEKPEIRAFCATWNIEPQKLQSVIQNEGVLGEMLDFADKLAYTSRDTEGFVGDDSESPWTPRWDLLQARPHVETFLIEHPKALNVWESIVVRDGHLVCTNPERLETFLKLRALMFRHLYTNPRARYNESLIVSLQLQYLYETKKLAKEDLLRMDDNDLRRILDEECGGAWYDDLSGTREPTYEVFDTLEEARERAKSLLEEGHTYVRTEDASNFFKSGTHFRVTTPDRPQPFEDVYPDKANEIRQMGATIDPIRVYYLKNPPETKPEFAGWVRSAFAEGRI